MKFLIRSFIFLTIQAYAGLFSKRRGKKEYRDSLTKLCHPKVGGSLGDTAEKLKREAKNLAKYTEEYIKKGKCVGDLC